MTYYIETLNSTYVLDDEEMTWERIKTSEDSGPLRTDGGELTAWPQIRIGEPLALLGPPIADHASARVIYTTAVTKICTYADEKRASASAGPPLCPTLPRQ